jgi:hypothetical protein
MTHKLRTLPIYCPSRQSVIVIIAAVKYSYLADVACRKNQVQNYNVSARAPAPPPPPRPGAPVHLDRVNFGSFEVLKLKNVIDFFLARVL